MTRCLLAAVVLCLALPAQSTFHATMIVAQNSRGDAGVSVFDWQTLQSVSDTRPAGAVLDNVSLRAALGAIAEASFPIAQNGSALGAGVRWKLHGVSHSRTTASAGGRIWLDVGPAAGAGIAWGHVRQSLAQGRAGGLGRIEFDGFPFDAAARVDLVVTPGTSRRFDIGFLAIADGNVARPIDDEGHALVVASPGGALVNHGTTCRGTELGAYLLSGSSVQRNLRFDGVTSFAPRHALMVVGFGQRAMTIPPLGCLSWTSLDIAVLVTPDPQHRAQLASAVPVGLGGAVFHVQYAALDQTGNWRLSNGIEVRL